MKSSVNGTRRYYSRSSFHRGQRAVRIRINTRTYCGRGIPRRQARKRESWSLYIHMRTTISRSKCKGQSDAADIVRRFAEGQIFLPVIQQPRVFSEGFSLTSFQKRIFAPCAPCLHNTSLIYVSFSKILPNYKVSGIRLSVRKIIYLALSRARVVDGQNTTRQRIIWHKFWIIEFWRVQVDKILMPDRNVDKPSEKGVQFRSIVTLDDTRIHKRSCWGRQDNSQFFFLGGAYELLYTWGTELIQGWKIES